ncbi:hypothetical protein HER39_20330 [Arthrobacter deserti]|uniref:Uncharacterized protein n=1 Tax=Arthrobacter deserti TaxID=1742687 RepID=A0ABX1JYQ9_9MICC|nr:hypothetical protein [Arthrobacter deserti]
MAAAAPPAPARAPGSGQTRQLPPAIRGSLPELLRLLHLGIILFRACDGSPDQERTRRLAANAVQGTQP